jgi:5-methylcytosine-specific restriction enzyme subunit McrC
MTEDKGILIHNIYYMLAYAFQELRQNNYADIEGEKFDDIYDLFAEILTRGVAYQLKQGLYREYVDRKESLPTVRGKININRTIANRMHNSNQIACDFDELSENNVYNQILVSAAMILIRHSDVKKDKKAKLKQLMLFFQNVQSIDVHSIRWDTLRFDRNNRNYRMLVYICYFIVKEWLMTTEEGNFKMREFSDEHMNRLFEKFVLEYYKKHHPEFKPCAAQIDWNIEKEQSTINILPIMQTDILLTMKERVLIIDTKYYSRSMQKQYNKTSIHSQNLYQMHTYVTEYDEEHKGNVDGMLLYAKTQEDIVPDGQMKHKDGNTIFFRTLDLNQLFPVICERLENIIEVKN